MATVAVAESGSIGDNYTVKFTIKLDHIKVNLSLSTSSNIVSLI